ncbi:hypothetical protein V8F20_011651 [Naviculisporaceae sp. PSN 640]
MRSSVIAAAFLAACAQAIKVTSPAKDQVVDLSAGFKVTFDLVSSDPTTAHLFLVNMAGGGEPFSKDLGEIDLTKPFVVTEEDVPAQKGYQFNVQSVSKDNTGILAQSQQFEVEEGTKKSVESTATSKDATTTKASTTSAASTVSSTASADADANVTGASTLATVTPTGSAASGKPTASSTSASEAAAPTGKAVAGGSILALAVAGLVAVMA